MALITEVLIRDASVIPSKLNTTCVYSMSGLTACFLAIGSGTHTNPPRGCVDIRTPNSLTAYFESQQSGGNTTIALEGPIAQWRITNDDANNGSIRIHEKNSGNLLLCGTTGGTVIIPGVLCAGSVSAGSDLWMLSGGSNIYYSAGDVAIGTDAVGFDGSKLLVHKAAGTGIIGVRGQVAAGSAHGNIQLYGCDDAGVYRTGSLISSAYSSVAAGAECTTLCIGTRQAGSVQTNICITNGVTKIVGIGCTTGNITSGAIISGATCVTTPQLCGSTQITSPIICSSGTIVAGANITSSQCIVATTAICSANICASNQLTAGANIVSGSCFLGTKLCSTGALNIQSANCTFICSILCCIVINAPGALCVVPAMSVGGAITSGAGIQGTTGCFTTSITSAGGITGTILCGSTCFSGSCATITNVCHIGITCGCIANFAACITSSTCLAAPQICGTTQVTSPILCLTNCANVSCNVTIGINNCQSQLWSGCLTLANRCGQLNTGFSYITFHACNGAGANLHIASIEGGINAVAQNTGRFIFRVACACTLLTPLFIEHSSICICNASLTASGAITSGAGIQGTILCGSTCMASPITCNTTCTATPVLCAGSAVNAVTSICSLGTICAGGVISSATCIGAGICVASARICASTQLTANCVSAATVTASGQSTGATVCGTTCVASARICASTQLTANCVSAATVTASGQSTGATVCGTTCVASAIGCFTTCLFSLGLVSSGNVCATNITAGTCVAAPHVCATTQLTSACVSGAVVTASGQSTGATVCGTTSLNSPVACLTSCAVIGGAVNTNCITTACICASTCVLTACTCATSYHNAPLVYACATYLGGSASSVTTRCSLCMYCYGTQFHTDVCMEKGIVWGCGTSSPHAAIGACRTTTGGVFTFYASNTYGTNLNWVAALDYNGTFSTVHSCATSQVSSAILCSSGTVVAGGAITSSTSITATNYLCAVCNLGGYFCASTALCSAGILVVGGVTSGGIICGTCLCATAYSNAPIVYGLTFCSNSSTCLYLCAPAGCIVLSAASATCATACLVTPVLCSTGSICTGGGMSAAGAIGSGAGVSGTVICGTTCLTTPHINVTTLSGTHLTSSCITASGCMCVGVAPTNANHVAPKCYVDAAASAAGGKTQSITFTSSCSWTVPTGISLIYVTLQAGGGGGGGGGAGGGGGGGWYYRIPQTVAAGCLVCIIVGAGGCCKNNGGNTCITTCLTTMITSGGMGVNGDYSTPGGNGGSPNGAGGGGSRGCFNAGCGGMPCGINGKKSNESCNSCGANGGWTIHGGCGGVGAINDACVGGGGGASIFYKGGNGGTSGQNGCPGCMGSGGGGGEAGGAGGTGFVLVEYGG